MRKFLVRLLCCFIPSKTMRHRLRNAFSHSKYDILMKDNLRLTDDINLLKKQLDKHINAPKPIPDYTFNGKNNKLLIWDNEKKDYVETRKHIPGLDITINGDNNVIKLDDVSIIKHLNIILNGVNHKVHIGKSLHTSYESVILDCGIIVYCNDCQLDIGDNFTTSHDVWISLAEPYAKCKIGNHVRLAEFTRIFTSDAHPIVDINTGECINYGAGKRCLTIGNNCWIGMFSYIAKDTVLPDYTIVAAHAVVTKTFTESYTVIAGVPAKVVKTGVKRIDMWNDALNKK